jgi:hypothetical protein
LKGQFVTQAKVLEQYQHTNECKGAGRNEVAVSDPAKLVTRDDDE